VLGRRYADFREHTFRRLSEKSRTCPQRSPVSRQEGAFRYMMVSVHLQICARSSAHAPFRTVSLGTRVNRGSTTPRLKPNSYRCLGGRFEA
jgi:hypothetical protein